MWMLICVGKMKFQELYERATIKCGWLVRSVFGVYAVYGSISCSRSVYYGLFAFSILFFHTLWLCFPFTSCLMKNPDRKKDIIIIWTTQTASFALASCVVLKPRYDSEEEQKTHNSYTLNNWLCIFREFMSVFWYWIFNYVCWETFFLSLSLFCLLVVCLEIYLTFPVFQWNWMRHTAFFWFVKSVPSTNVTINVLES